MTTVTDVAALRVDELTIAYDGTTVVRGIGLEVASGKVAALLGPNGAGKTTVLRCVSGLLPARHGKVELFGEDITRETAARRARLGLCHIPEGRGIYRNLSVRENLLVQAPKGEQSVAIERALDLFPRLSPRLGLRAGLMSGGEQQMLALAAAFVRSPRLVVVDEVSLGLSPIMVDEMFKALSALAADGVALLIVDQFVDRALEIADSAYVMRKGQISFFGSRDELRNADIFDHYSAAGASNDGAATERQEL